MDRLEMSGGAARNFIKQLLSNLNESARATARPGYDAQSEKSCLAMYGLCMMTDPDFVLDVGTARGASCLTLAYALRSLGKDPARQLMTVCIHQGRWAGYGIPYNAELAHHHGIDIKGIQTVEGDFRTVYPPKQVKNGAPTFIFYDIHDHDDSSVPPSCHLLNEWVPAISRGIVAIHDVYSEKHAPRHAAIAHHFGLGPIYGRLEIMPIVKYLNARGGQLIELPGTSLVFFCIEDGKVR